MKQSSISKEQHYLFLFVIVTVQSDEDDGAITASKWLFSPRDVDVADCPPLVGRHGLGYRGMDQQRTSVLTAKSVSTSSNRLRIKGHVRMFVTAKPLLSSHFIS